MLLFSLSLSFPDTYTYSQLINAVITIRSLTQTLGLQHARNRIDLYQLRLIGSCGF